jgi:predicted amidophosphoribosyltransferase
VHHPNITSYSARYLLIEPGYTVLKKWKTQRGLLFDRQILKSTPALRSHWREIQANAVVPVPQNYSRSWKMAGSRAEQIARWVSQETQVPTFKLLEVHRSFQNKRQAELPFVERIQNHHPFYAEETNLKALKKIILVDDFMTTGRTLQQAAKVLKNSGVGEIHVFCLGSRAFRLNSEC